MSTQQQNPGEQIMKSTYVFTEEETKLLVQCRSESFWFSALPMSSIAMLSTGAMIKKGILTASGPFGPFPKIAFAGFMGFMFGKIAYANRCREKFMKLENSTLGEHIRQAKLSNMLKHPSPSAELTSDDVPSTPSSHFISSSHEPELSSAYSSHFESSKVEVPFGSSMSESSTTGISDSIAQEPEFPVEKQDKPSSVTYEQLRNKHRSSYEVLTPQSPARPIQNRAPKIEDKKNKYGDVWED
ncbi:OCIA domain-containing protein 1 [Mantella aurantiaca]